MSILAATQAPRRWWAALLPVNFMVPLAVVGVALTVGLGLIAMTGASIPDTISAFLLGAFGSSYAIGASLNRAVPFILVGLGFILAAKANLTNVGGEGQIAVGGMIAAAVALHGGADLPSLFAVATPLFAGSLAGAFWGWIAGIAKVKRGTNEVISTLLLSFVAVDLVYWSVQSVALLRKPQTSAATQPESLEIPDATKLPLLNFDASSPLHIGILIAAAAVIVVAVLLARSIFSMRLRAIGLNPLAAMRAGMSENLQPAALALAGGLGGLAGAIMIQGDQHVLKIGFSSNYGFDGLVVGLLSRGSALGVVVGALFFAFLRSGGMSMEMIARVPSAVVWICEGLIVVAIASSTAWLDYRRKSKEGRA
jgi:general nucleoside transport system permease protein